MEFGGSIIEYNKKDNKIEISPSEEKLEEILGRDPQTSKRDLQSIMGTLNQLSQCQVLCAPDAQNDWLKQRICVESQDAGIAREDETVRQGQYQTLPI